MVFIVNELFKLLDAKITHSSIKDKLLQHPKFPSLFSITNTLENFGLKNKAVKIESKQLSQLEVPFLALMNSRETVLVKSVKKDTITYLHPVKGWLTKSVQEFGKTWNNLVVLVDTSSQLEEDNYSRQRNFEKLKKLRPIISIILVGLLLTLIPFGLNTILQGTLFLTNILGLTIGILLIRKEIHTGADYAFCKIGKKIDCEDVLNSKAAKIFSWLSLSDIGLLYFSGNLLLFASMAIGSFNQAADLMGLLILLGLLALPYTFYSIFYQGFVIKKWCPLCLGVLIVLWTNALFGCFYAIKNDYGFDFSTNAILISGACFTIPILVWIFLKGILKKSIDYEALYYSNMRMVNDLTIFQLLLENQEVIPLDLQETEITLGNSELKDTIVVAINPFCPSCGREYNHILNLIEKHPGFAKVVLRFVGHIQSKNWEQIHASTLIIDKYLENKSEFPEILEYWFTVRNMAEFLKKYPASHKKESETMLKNHFTWSERVRIVKTPTTFLNDKKIPDNYDIKHIIGILDMKP